MAEERRSMSEDNVVQPPSPQEIEASARGEGWVPKEEWRGDPEAWVDAKTFVDRGKQFLPFVNAKAKRFEEEAQQLRSTTTTQAARISELETQIKDLQETSSEIVKLRVKEERERLKEEIKAAREAEDVDREIAATEKLTQLTQAPPKQEPPKPTNLPPQQTAEATAAFNNWKAKYPSIVSDPVKNAAAAHFAVTLAKAGQLDGLSVEQRGDRIAQEVLNYFKQYERQAPVSRVNEGNSRNGTGGVSTSGGGPGKRTYNDLPAEARQVCDRQAKRVVKPNSRFDTEQKFREHYVSMYYADEVA